MHRIALALVTSALLATACTSTRAQPNPTIPTPVEVKRFVDGRWEALPLQPGVESLYWSGRALLLYGRERDANAASIRVFDPTTQAVRTVPVPGPDRRSAITVWTGRELLVIGGRPTNGDLPLHDYAFEPVTNNWREIAPSPLTPRGNAPIVWTGREAIIVSGFDATPGKSDGIPAPGAGAYDPTTDTWRTITAPDVTATDALVDEAVWTGTEIIVWGVRGPRATAVVTAYNPTTDSWRELEPPPASFGHGSMSWAVYNNGKLIALSNLAHAAEFDITANHWQPLPDFMDRGYLMFPQLITIGDEVVAVLRQLKVLTADRSAWQLGPPAPEVGHSFMAVTRLAWTGRELYATDAGGGFAKYVPSGPVG